MSDGDYDITQCNILLLVLIKSVLSTHGCIPWRCAGKHKGIFLPKKKSMMARGHAFAEKCL